MQRQVALWTINIFLIFSLSSGFACNLWNHRWRLIRESWSSAPNEDVLEGFDCLRGASKKAKPFLISAPWLKEIATTTFGFAQFIGDSNDNGANGDFFREKKIGGYLTDCPRYLHRQAWSIDESLPRAALIRWENMTNSVIRWVEFDDTGKIMEIDESAVISGWVLTISAMPCWMPIERFERYLGGQSPIASFSQIENLIPSNFVSATETMQSP